MRKSIVSALLALLLLSSAAQGEVQTVYEAEQAKLTGETKLIQDANASQGAAVGRFTADGDEAVFTVTISEDGFYDLSFFMHAKGMEKHNIVAVDGVELGQVVCWEEGYAPCVLKNTYLTAGSHTVSLRKDWGWVSLDRLEVLPSSGISDAVYQVKSGLVNLFATQETRQLYETLRGYYGRYILSGQQTDQGIQGPEFQAILDATGKYPAIMGLDMANYTASRIAQGGRSTATDDAIAFHDLGGIVTCC